MTTTLEPGLIFVLCLLILAANLAALYGIIRLAATHALDVHRRRAEKRAQLWTTTHKPVAPGDWDA